MNTRLALVNSSCLLFLAIREHCRKKINRSSWNLLNSSLSRTFFILLPNHHLYISNHPPSFCSSANYTSTSRSNYTFNKEKIPSRKRKAMDIRLMGFDSPLFSTLQHMLDVADESDKSVNAPTRTYVRDAKAMAATPADIKEYPSSYVFIIDMPGLKSGDIKVQVEDDNVLLISGERKRDEEKEGSAKYVRMERRVGKFMRKFVLPENADINKISAVCQDGVLTVSVEKLPPPEPKKPKTVEVKVV